MLPNDPRLQRVSDLIFERLGLTKNAPQTKENEIAAMYLRELIMPTLMASTIMAANGYKANKIIEVLRALADGLELILQETEK